MGLHHPSVPDFRPYSKYVAEFIGTFFLVFTIGNNVLGNNAVWGATSIACVLMVMIYSLGGVSGANFNPAVSIALACSKKLDLKTCVLYVVVQCFGAIVAAFCYKDLRNTDFELKVNEPHDMVDCFAVEFLYTFMLCFVVLNVAASTETGNCPNQFYGLAISFVIIAGGYAAGSISGGAFNPAVAVAIDISSASKSFGNCFLYTLYEILGAVMASVLHRVVRPKEYGITSIRKEVSVVVSEFVGTFFLVLTIGLNVLGSSPAAAFSIAASLLSMIYSLGNVSGAHFNPAVTWAVYLSGRGAMAGGAKMAGIYTVVQILAGVAGGLVYSGITGSAFPLQPNEPGGFNWGHALIAEVAYTCCLVFVVLSVGTTAQPSKDMFGLAIGSCVTVGGYAIGGISGGSLNPAVSWGIDVANAVKADNDIAFGNCLFYTLFEMSGTILAVAAFVVIHNQEYHHDADEVEQMKRRKSFHDDKGTTDAQPHGRTGNMLSSLLHLIHPDQDASSTLSPKAGQMSEGQVASV